MYPLSVYRNTADDEKLFRQLNYFTPPILQLFFIRSGLSFRLDMLFGTSASLGSVSLITIGVCYFIARIVGKYAGSFLGSAVIHKPENVRNYLGLALIPQAGVAIGLAALGARTLGGEAGMALETVILASSVLYELMGPGCAKLSLYLSRSYAEKPEEPVAEEKEEVNAVDQLIERIAAIQKELSAEKMTVDEAAFQEAADEHAAALSVYGRRK